VALAFVGGLANKTLAQGLVNETMKLALGESAKISNTIRKKVILLLLDLMKIPFMNYLKNEGLFL
jgi:hypothetical protein